MRVRWRLFLVVAPFGIVLVVAILGAGVWLWFRPSLADRQAIENRYTLWHASLGKKQFVNAYELMAPEYRSSHSLQEFSEEFESSGESWLRLRPGYSLRVHASGGRLYPLDHGTLELWNGPDYEWVKIADEWFLTGHFDLYYD